MKLMLGSLFLVNAAAATALIAFAGNANSDSLTVLSQAGLKSAIVWVGVGAVLAIAASGCAAMQENRLAFQRGAVPISMPVPKLGAVAGVFIGASVLSFL